MNTITAAIILVNNISVRVSHFGPVKHVDCWTTWTSESKEQFLWQTSPLNNVEATYECLNKRTMNQDNKATNNWKVRKKVWNDTVTITTILTIILTAILTSNDKKILKKMLKKTYRKSIMPYANSINPITTTKQITDIAPPIHIAPLLFTWIIVPATTNMFGSRVSGFWLS